MENTISRTPLRISFVGGGTDIANFYRKYGGEVISTTIDKYITVEVSRREDRKIAVRTDEAKAGACERVKKLTALPPRSLAPSPVTSLDEVKHPLIREAMRKTGVVHGVSIEVSAQGTGLGSSSALTVGLLNALYAYRGRRCNAEKLARDACDIEINILGNPIGKQDQYAAAYGGLRRFWFELDDSVVVESLPQKDVRNNGRCSPLEKYLMLFDTGIQRSANTILSEQKRAASPTSLLKNQGTGPKSLQRADTERFR